MTEKNFASPGPRVLIVLLGAIGDVARGLCLLSDLKRHWKDCHITWAVEPKSADLVAAHPLIDRVLIYQRQIPVLGSLKFLRQLRSNNYDIVIDLQRHFKSGLISFLSGANRRLGFHWRDTKEGNFLFNNEFVAESGEKVAKLDVYRSFLEKLGLPIGEVDFGFGELQISEKVGNLFPKIEKNKPKIGVILGTSWQSKKFPNQGYLSLTEKLLEKGYAVIALGIGEDKIAQALDTNFSERCFFNLHGKNSLAELLEVLSLLDVVVGPDSGPGHIAAAVGTPYVGIFGPTNPQRTAPYGSERLVVRSNLGCSPCYRRRCPGLNTSCMRLINVREIVDKVDGVIKSGTEGVLR